MRITRREMLAGMGAFWTWMAAGCQTESPRIIESLPDPLPPTKADRLVDAVPYAPPPLPIATRPATAPATMAATRPVPVTAPAVVTDDIIPRSSWARGGPILSKTEPMDGVQLITFHHSGDPIPFYDNGFAETATHLENVRTWHTHAVVNRSKPQGAGMCDIGYHFAIDRMGRVWELRNTQYQGEHVAGHNPHNLGVVVLGNFDLQSPTAAQWARIQTFGGQLRRLYRLPISRIYTHQELKSTACPGKNMQPRMVTIRNQSLI